MTNEINLAKIPAKETITEKWTGFLDGSEREFEIRGLYDTEKLNVLTTMQDETDPGRHEAMYVFLLSRGLGVTSAVARAMLNSSDDRIRNDAFRCADRIWHISDVFDKAKLAELKEAEKNSAGETTAQ